MSIDVRGEPDHVVDQMAQVMGLYEVEHPHSRVSLRRQNRFSIRIRVIDPWFRGRNKVERHDEVWRYLERLPDEVVTFLSALILLAPEEVEASLLNAEFEDPIPSGV